MIYDQVEVVYLPHECFQFVVVIENERIPWTCAAIIVKINLRKQAEVVIIMIIFIENIETTTTTTTTIVIIF